MIKEPFYDAEQVVQWVSDSNRMKGVHQDNRIYDRPCEVSDIYITVKRLKMSGKINAIQYLLFDKLTRGEIDYVPDRFYDKWKDFLSKLDMALKTKNIIARGVA